MEYNKVIVQNPYKKEKVYSYLKRSGFSENYLKNLRKKEGFILINDKIAHTDFIVNEGDSLLLCKNPNTKSSIMLSEIPLDIVYEDDNILIVNKPSGLATSASRSHYAENLSGAILNYMLEKDENFVVRIVGRLDKDTAGLIVVAKHSVASNLLSEKGKIKKTYYAIATGKIEKELTIKKNILTTQNELGYNNIKREISEFGKPAITHIFPVSYDGQNTLCRIHIEHGRTHQIRVHLASNKTPLLGDEIYGNISKKINHTALACTEISFELFGKEYYFKIPLPDDIKNAFNKEILENI